MSETALPPALPDRAEVFLNDVAGEQERTRRTYRNGLVRLQAFAESVGYTKPRIPLPDALRPEFLSDYFSWLREQKSARGGKYRADSLRLYLIVARRYLHWLDGAQLLPAHARAFDLEAALEQKLGKRKSVLRRQHREPDDSVGALLDYFASQIPSLPEGPKGRRQRLILLRNQALLQVLYATAGRASEVAQLTRANVAEGHANSVEIYGKGNKRRPLLLTEAAQKAIRDYLREREDSNSGLFISHRITDAAGGESITSATIWAIVNEAAKGVYGTVTYRKKNGEAGERPKIRVGPHAFRHLRAQHLSDEGLPITSLQTFLGHASIATTRDIYAPRTPDEKLLDELQTYGRDPEKVAQQGKKRAEQD